jgi:hypothetical protein
VSISRVIRDSSDLQIDCKISLGSLVGISVSAMKAMLGANVGEGVGIIEGLFDGNFVG